MSSKHEAILKSMLAGVKPPLGDAQMKSIGIAMKAFSTAQLEKMEDAGVRIWPFAKGLPPDYPIQSVPDLASPADYNFQFRTIRISPASLEKSAITDFLRHELAHAWDDVRSGKSPKSLRKLKGDAWIEEADRRGKLSEHFESQSPKKLPPHNFSMQEMLQRYKDTVNGFGDKTRTFAHDSTAEKHNRKNVMEFYAEGYSVFHGFSELSKARMLWLAPELFDYLDHEAQAHKLASPSRPALKKILLQYEKVTI